MAVIVMHRAMGLILYAIVASACLPEPVGEVVVTHSPPSSPTASAIPTFKRPTPTPQPAFTVYVVRTGDSLTGIAAMFRTSARSIAFWNRGAYPSLDPDSPTYAPDRIAVGWQLRLIPGVEVDEDALPDASPATTPGGSGPGPGPSATVGIPVAASSAGVSPGAIGASKVVRHGSRDSRLVALTFESSGPIAPAVDIMDWLIEQRLPVAVFTTGETGTTTEDGQAVLDLVVDHRALFTLGNLSWSYPDLRALDDPAIRDQLERTEVAVIARTAISTKPWFRPPYGELDEQIPATAGSGGWGYTVLWDVDPLDGKPEADGGPTADAIVQAVLDDVEGGSIIRLHLAGEHTLEALPGIVDGLEAAGLVPVSLAAMFGN